MLVIAKMLGHRQGLITGTKPAAGRLVLRREPWALALEGHFLFAETFRRYLPGSESLTVPLIPCPSTTV
jgi:hypothetical protein